MAQNPFGGGTVSHSPFPSASSSSHKASGVGGLFENLAGDVKDAVVGFPAGAVHLVEHPVGGLETMAKSTWETWSPLFQGHFGQFAHGVYEHPLAPLLDLATVFDAGLGAAGKLGEITDASGGSLLGKAAKLREPKSVPIRDLSGKGRHELSFHYSTKPLRRLTQEHILPAVTSKLPESAQTALGQGKYEKAFYSDMAHRAAAKSVMMTTAMLAGKALTDPVTAPRARQEIAAGLVLNLHRHAPLSLTPEEAVSFLQTNKHYLPLRDPSQIDRTHSRLLKSTMSKEARYEGIRSRTAELAHSLPKIQNELDQQNAILRDMHDKGYHIVMPAKTKLREPTVKQLMNRNAAPVKEVEANVARLEKQLARAHTAKVLHDKAAGALPDLTARRMDLQQRSFAQYFQNVGSSEEAFNSFVRNLGARATVSIGRGTKAHIEAAVSKAARTTDGKIRLVPKHDPSMLGHEAANSSNFVKWLYKKPTSVWKTIQVGWTPRTVTNNGVGNYLLYALREEPVSGTAGLMNALKITHGDEQAGQIIMHATPFKRNHWMFRNFSTELNNVFGHELLDGAGARISTVKSGFYPLVHKIADEPVRMAAISAYLRRDPAVRALMRDNPKLTFDQAASRALRKDRGLQQRAAEHARTIAGDYQTLRPWERKLKDIAPFYLWDRHIMKSTGNLVADTPGRAVLIQQTSKMGKDQTEKYLGSLPEFLQGAVPLEMLGLGHKSGDRANALLTTSLNPFATIGDIAGLGQAVTVGHNVNPGNALFSQVNPILTGAVSYGMGTNLLTGAPEKAHGGVVTSIGHDLGTGFPEYRIVQGMLEPTTTVTPKGNEKMFAQDHLSAISSFLGVPVRNISKSATLAAANKEQGIKKGRTRKKNPFL